MLAAFAIGGLLAAAAVCALVAADLGLRPHLPGARSLAVGCGGAGLWAAAYAGELQASSAATIVRIVQVEYLGIVLATLFLYLGVSSLTGQRPLRGMFLLGAVAAPVGTLVAVATNDLHHLFWSEIGTVTENGLTLLDPVHGPLFWAHTAWAYALLGLTAWMLVRTARTTGSAALRAALVAIVAPWLASLLYVTGLTVLDPTPFAVAIGAVAIAVALQRHELIPSGRVAPDALVDAVLDGVLVVDRDGRIAHANTAAGQLLGRSSGALVGRRLADLLPGADRGVAEVVLGTAARPRPCHVTVSPIEDGRLVMLRESPLRTLPSEPLLEEARDIVFTTTLDGRLRSLNRAGRELFGVEAAVLGERGLGDLVGADAGPTLLDRLVTTGDVTEEATVVDRSGRAHAIEIRATRVEAPDGEMFFQGIARDVTDRRQLEADVARALHHDDLTGLPNRTLLRQRLGEAALEAARGGAPFAVAVLDVDGFGDLNARYGEHVGDDVLREIAVRLQPHLREPDLLARLAGDEFAAIVLDVDEVEVAEAIARRLRDAIAEPFTLRGTRRAIGASVGVALCPAHGTDGDILLRRADIAMRVAKAERVGVGVYRRSLDVAAADRLALADDLRRALAEDALGVVYQPQVALYDGRTTGVEALARWDHPLHGPIPPDRFIPLAEENGLIGQLDQLVLRRALGDLARLHADGHVFQLAVNLSALDLADPRLAERVAAEADAAGIETRYLTVELTESTVMRDPAHDGAVLRRLRDAGAAVAIDDFGTGYSSLAYLSELPVAELKIDRSFVRGAVAGVRERAIVRSVASLGRDLGLRVHAEGVEDGPTLDLVRELGYGFAQGWHIARPMAYRDLRAWLSTGVRRRG